MQARLLGRRSALRVSGKPEGLNCLIADFEFRKGVGTARSLLLDAEKVVIVGEGDVDLGREQVQLRLVPRPRRASPLSTAVTVQLEGPLTAPRIEIEKESLPTSTTEAVFRNVLSLSGAPTLWQRLRGKKSRRSPCEALVEALR